MPVELSDIPTSELVAELENRSVASVICLVLPNDPNSTETKTWHSGNDFTLLGLAEAAAYRMRRKIYSELQPGSDED